jgi:hypothetical protein
MIERMFCRLKDFRRIATRYDKRVDIYLSSILLAAAVTWVDQLSLDPSAGKILSVTFRFRVYLPD